MNTNQLDWDKDTQSFSAEASTVGFGGQVSMVLSSDLRDELVTLILTHVEVDVENDVRWWDYTPSSPAWARRFNVRIYND